MKRFRIALDRFFSAKTLPPISHITKGPNSSGEIIGPNFTFEWEGVDPDGSETGGQAPCDSFECTCCSRTAAGPS